MIKQLVISTRANITLYRGLFSILSVTATIFMTLVKIMKLLILSVRVCVCVCVCVSIYIYGVCYPVYGAYKITLAVNRKE